MTSLWPVSLQDIDEDIVEWPLVDLFIDGKNHEVEAQEESEEGLSVAPALGPFHSGYLL